jgi:hypothetical protein
VLVNSLPEVQQHLDAAGLYVPRKLQQLSEINTIDKADGDWHIYPYVYM